MYQKLNDKYYQRRVFDPSSDADTKELLYFLKNGRWENTCPFYSEFPWVNIPVMCQHKYAVYNLEKLGAA